MVGDGDDFWAFIKLDAKYSMVSRFDWNITSCIDRFRKIDHACGGAVGPNTWYCRFVPYDERDEQELI